MGGPNEYELQSIQYHIHSEHTLDGRHCDLELQFIHVNPENDAMAIMAILYDFGEHDFFLDELTHPLHQIANRRDRQLDHDETLAIEVDLALMELHRNYVSYDGSLTYPP